MPKHPGGWKVHHLMPVHVYSPPPEQGGHKVFRLLGGDAVVVCHLGLDVGECLWNNLLQEHDVSGYLCQGLDDGSCSSLKILLIEAINVPRDEGELLRGLGGQQA